MGCVSSKLLKKNLQQELLYGNGELPNHVVSLTSSTYGVLKLEQDQAQLQIEKIKQVVERKREDDGPKVEVLGSKKSPQKEGLEVINAWELMGDLEDETAVSHQQKKSPKLMGFRGGNLEKVERSPFKSLSRVGSPKTVKKLGGKENKSGQHQQQQQNDCISGGDGKVGSLDSYSTPKGMLKSWNNSSSNSSNKHRKATCFESPRRSNSGVLTSRRKSLSPLFNPDLIHSIDKELSQEMKKMISPKKLKSQSPKPRYPKLNSASLSLLEKYEEKCPPGGENCVVIYTTTLRGIRKTFEDCNAVRSIVESYHIRLLERDISMDSGFKEELRKLMGRKEVKVPLVFVKGRLIGGADEVLKLEEEGKLEGLLDGIPIAKAVCQGCGGIRFIMCVDCNGSCKVLDDNQNKMVKCAQCNENGLVHCPFCC